MPSLPIALTMGEPAGVGGELTLKAWHRLRRTGRTFFAVDDPERLARIGRRIGVTAPLRPIGDAAEANGVFADALPVLPLSMPHDPEPGRPDPANGGAVVESIDRAVALARTGAVAAIVTNPIHKETLYGIGFRYPGHTEYLAALAGGVTPEMLLVCPGLRVVPLTVHVPLRAALDQITHSAILACCRRTAAALASDFGIARPRLAVAGLNPHAGEGGTIGREDVEIIAPAIAELRREGLQVSGPHAPDSMFHAAARAGYDVAICMYHDQALIPLKTIDFLNGVNVTLGLPFVRTSPDHGTAFALAGTGRASDESLVAAIELADDIASRRAARG